MITYFGRYLSLAFEPLETDGEQRIKNIDVTYKKGD